MVETKQQVFDDLLDQNLGLSKQMLIQVGNEDTVSMLKWDSDASDETSE